MKITPVSFDVSGYGSFPIDMLRYDGVVPSTPADSARIENSIRGKGSEYNIISVTKHNGYKHWAPSTSRWKSFGWTVSSVSQVPLDVTLYEGKENG